MLDHILLHLETKADPRGFPEPHKMTAKLGVSMLVMYEFSRNRYLVFDEASQGQIVGRLLAADWITGYDLLGYVFPTIFATSPEEFRLDHRFRYLSSRTNCFLRRLAMGMGLVPDACVDLYKKINLNTLIENTVGRLVANHGYETPIAMQASNWAAGISHAMDSAVAQVELAVFIEKHGYVIGDDGVKISMRSNMRGPLEDAAFLGRQG